MKCFQKFVDIQLNKQDHETISLSLLKFQENNNESKQVSEDKLCQIENIQSPLELKVLLMQSFKQKLEEQLLNYKNDQKKLDYMRKIQIKELEGQQNATQQSKKEEIEQEILQNEQTISEIEKSLVCQKAERNTLSEHLEDIKFEVIDIKQQLLQFYDEERIADNHMSILKNKITQMTQKGLSTAREYSNNLNTTRVNTTRLGNLANNTIIKDGRFSITGLKDFFKDKYQMFLSKGNSSKESKSTNILADLDT